MLIIFYVANGEIFSPFVMIVSYDRHLISILKVNTYSRHRFLQTFLVQPPLLFQLDNLYMNLHCLLYSIGQQDNPGSPYPDHDIAQLDKALKM